MAKRKTRRDILIEARALLARPRGWIKGDVNNGRGGYCAFGAICDVAWVHGASLLPVTEALRRELPEGYDRLTVFNDHRSTRKRDVLALFDRAIERLTPKPKEG